MSRLVSYQQPKGLTISDYTPMVKNGTVTSSATANTLVTVLSVTGKGLLHKAVVQTISGGGASETIKITVDGTVIYWHRCNSNNDSGVGLAVNEEVFTLGSTGSRYTTGGTSTIGCYANSIGKQYPLATLQTTVDGIFQLPMPIEFNTSLLIEASCNSTSYPITHGISYALAN